MTKYLSVLHIATAGVNGPLLGTDEEEVVLMCVVIVDTSNSQVNIFLLIHSRRYEPGYLIGI